MFPMLCHFSALFQCRGIDGDRIQSIARLYRWLAIGRIQFTACLFGKLEKQLVFQPIGHLALGAYLIVSEAEICHAA